MMTVAAAITFLLGFFGKEEIKIKVNKAFIFLSAILLATTVSYFLARTKYDAFWGNNNIPSDGLLSVIICFLFALLLAQYMDELKNRKILEIVFVSAMTVLGAYGVIQHFGWDPVDWWGYKQWNLNAYGTIGQAVGFASILGSAYPLLLATYLKQEEKKNLFFMAAVIFIVTLGLMYSGSRMPMVVTFLMTALILGFYWFRATGESKKIKIGLVISVILFSQAVYYGEASDNALTKKLRPDVVNTGLAERMQVWRDAVKIWERNPWFGIGPENFAVELKHVNTKDFNSNQNWALFWHKAHNHLIHYLATLGAFGFLAHLAWGIFGAFLFLKLLFKKSWSEPELTQLAYIGGFAFIYIANMTAFNFVLTQLFYFCFPVMCLVVDTQKPQRVLTLKTPKALTSANVVLASVLLAMFGYEIFNFWNADRNFSMSRRVLYINNDMKGALAHIDAAIAAKDADSRYHMRKASYMHTIYKRQIEVDRAHFNPEAAWRDVEQLTAQGVARDPENSELWFYRGRLLADLFVSRIMNDPAPAEKSFLEGQKYSPANPIFPYNLGLIYVSSGRIMQFIASMRQAIDLKPDYIPAYTQLLRYYYSQGNQTEASLVINDLEKTKVVAAEFLPELKSLTGVAQQSGDQSGAIRISRVYEKHAQVIQESQK